MKRSNRHAKPKKKIQTGERVKPGRRPPIYLKCQDEGDPDVLFMCLLVQTFPRSSHSDYNLDFYLDGGEHSVARRQMANLNFDTWSWGEKFVRFRLFAFYYLNLEKKQNYLKIIERRI